MGVIAQPFTVLEVNDEKKLIEELQELIEAEHVDKVIVGLPKKLNGTVSQAADEVLKWVGSLRESLKVPIETWDERLSSKEAERVLLEGDLSRSKRKKKIDKIAAQIILQNYLDAHSFQGGTLPDV